VRELLRRLVEVEQAPSQDPSTSSFALTRFSYFSLLEEGYPQPTLFRVAHGALSPAAVRETVSSPGLGAGGFHFILSHFAVCPSEEKVALAGEVGGTPVLCIREPSLNKTECTEAPSISSLAWAANCDSLLYTNFENGRSTSLFLTSANSPDTSVTLLRETNPAFSLSLKVSDDELYFIVSSCSPQHCDLHVASREAEIPHLTLVVDRTADSSLSLYRGIGAWWGVTRRGYSNPVLRPVENLWPLKLGTPVPLGSVDSPPFILGKVRGFNSFLLLEGRLNAAPALALYQKQDGFRPLTLPSDLTKFSALPVQSFGGSRIRILAEGPAVQERYLEIAAAEPRISAPVKLPYSSRVVEIASTAGTKVPVTLFWNSAAASKGNATASCTASIFQEAPVHLLRASCPSRWVLHSYGAYGTSLDPGYSKLWQILLEKGVGIAIAHIRGGGENGPAWHDAARGTGRLTAVADLISVARALAPGRVLLQARSAGALTAVMALHQEPQAFQGALLEAPFLDVLATLDDRQRPSSVRETAEWGDPTDPVIRSFWSKQSPEFFKWPTPPPPLFVSLGEDDEAISPASGVTWLSELEKNSGADVLLQWIEHGGHSGAKTEADKQRAEAEQLSWVLQSFAGH